MPIQMPRHMAKKILPCLDMKIPSFKSEFIEDIDFFRQVTQSTSVKIEFFHLHHESLSNFQIHTAPKPLVISTF